MLEAVQISRSGPASFGGAAADDAAVAFAGASVEGRLVSTSIGRPFAAITVIDAGGAAHEYLCGIGPGRASQNLLIWALQRWSAAHVVVTVDVNIGQRLGTIDDGTTRIWVDVYALS